MIADGVNTNQFNAPSELFGSNRALPEAPKKYLQPIAQEDVGVDDRPKNPYGEGGRVEQEQQVRLGRRTLVGSFSAVRAARVLHQNMEEMWAADGLTSVLAATASADPSADEISQMYDDLILFSDLPPALTPSREDVEDWFRPRRREAVVHNSLPNVGVKGYVEDVALETATPDNVVLLAPPAPFSSTQLSTCEANLRLLLGTSAES